MLRNFVAYLLCTFSPCTLTLICAKTFFFATLTLDAKKLYNCVTLFLEVDEVTVGHICETFRNYNFGREVTFSIQVAIIATSNTPLNVII